MGFVGKRSWMDTPTQTGSVLKAMYRKPLVSGLKIQDKMAPDMRTGPASTQLLRFLSKTWMLFMIRSDDLLLHSNTNFHSQLVSGQVYFYTVY